MSAPVAWRRLEYGPEHRGVLVIQVHRDGSLWRVMLEEEGAHDPQMLFHGAGPVHDVAQVANQSIACCTDGGWRVITGSASGAFSAHELAPPPADTTPICTIYEALFAS